MSRSTALRLVVVVAAMAVAWQFAGLVFGDARAPAVHLLRGALVSSATLAAVVLLLRLDGLPWCIAGHHAPLANLRAFALGASLWLVPALLGAIACVALGWSSIRPQSPPATLLAALPALALGVFLFEAFPEELGIRGYVQGLLARRTAQWVALLLQAVVFTAFAWAVGALDTVEAWSFIPCLALILGYVRALTGSVWAGIGVHTAWMTTAQLLSAHFSIEGRQALQFVAFALLPSACIGSVLGAMRPDFGWRRPAAA